MEQNNILNSFNNILLRVKQKSGRYDISATGLAIVKKEIEMLSNCFSVSSHQIILLTIIIDMCRYGTISIDNLSDSLKCNFFTFLRLKNDIDILKAKDLLEGDRNLSLSMELIDSLENNSPYKLPLVSDLTTGRIMERLSKMISYVSDRKKVPSSLLKLMDRMILANPSTSVAMACDRYSVLSYSSLPVDLLEEDSSFNVFNNESYSDSVSPDERMLFYVLLSFSNDMIKWNDLACFFRPSNLRHLQRNYNNGILDLQRFGVLEYSGDDEYVKINSYVKEQVYADIIIEQKKVSAYPLLIKSSDIKEHHLFFPKDTDRQLLSVSSLLSKERYINVRNSLLHQGFRTGFAVLFYGGPGTGKTEGVYQLARNTGRDIISVNVSQLKDQYVGESEKNVKKVFDNYRSYVSDYGTFPILLFNEADSILGTRKGGSLSAVDKMENTIQNIILQEMENLDGIMVATTNLVFNLDRAFERRFLYKVCFTQPDESTRSKIWKSMIPELSSSDADSLALDFNLSGGQIENICRKRIIQTIVSESNVTMNMIRKLCSEELLSKSATLGFSLK